MEVAKRLAGHAIDLENRATIVVRLSESKTNTIIRSGTNHTYCAVRVIVTSPEELGGGLT
ncbi:hypothetical protein Pla52n_06040 [Stieleria varia]|uniref:Uncharacterized protein n=1 Tax=Stieleria varia TaxID=2528005 RepID=A0A5C6B9U6_9BACT|nr:hypothetical protein Pla52n_06040 [Stieleria varia]